MSDFVMTTRDGEKYGQYRGYNYAINSDGTYSMCDLDDYCEFKNIDELHDYIDRAILARNHECLK